MRRAYAFVAVVVLLGLGQAFGAAPLVERDYAEVKMRGTLWVGKVSKERWQQLKPWEKTQLSADGRGTFLEVRTRMSGWCVHSVGIPERLKEKAKELHGKKVRITGEPYVFRSEAFESGSGGLGPRPLPRTEVFSGVRVLTLEADE